MANKFTNKKNFNRALSILSTSGFIRIPSVELGKLECNKLPNPFLFKEVLNKTVNKEKPKICARNHLL